MSDGIIDDRKNAQQSRLEGTLKPAYSRKCYFSWLDISMNDPRWTQDRPKIDPTRPNIGSTWPNTAQHRVNMAQHEPTMAQVCPNKIQSCLEGLPKLKVLSEMVSKHHSVPALRSKTFSRRLVEVSCRSHAGC